MGMETTVLSLSFDVEKLRAREAGLREAGFEVVNAYSPGQARFEIETGRCGIFVTCSLVPDIVNRDLVNLFRRHCSAGFVILVSGEGRALVDAHEPLADIRISPANDPQGIPEAVREYLKTQVGAG